MLPKPFAWKIQPYCLLAVLIIASLLAGCGGAQPRIEPTVDTRPTFNVVQTEAAETVVAGITKNAPTATPIVATATSAPTETPAPTETAAPPTATLVPPTWTPVPKTNTPYPTATSKVLNCTVVEQSPKSGDSFTTGAPFDGKWIVKNTGEDTWKKTEVDFRYISGTKFQEHVNAVDLTTDVENGDKYTVIIDMLAPKDPGRYSATWAFVQGNQVICPVYVNIVVK